MPSWVFRGHDAIAAVDVGGSSFRAGIIDLNLKRASNLAKASVWKSDEWRYAEDKPSRDEAVAGLIKMLQKLIARDPFGFRVALQDALVADGELEHTGNIEAAGLEKGPGMVADGDDFVL